METKRLWESKTIIFNVLTLLAILLSTVITQDMLSTTALKWVVVFQSLVNAALRLVTDQPVKITDK